MLQGHDTDWSEDDTRYPLPGDSKAADYLRLATATLYSCQQKAWRTFIRILCLSMRYRAAKSVQIDKQWTADLSLLRMKVFPVSRLTNDTGSL